MSQQMGGATTYQESPKPPTQQQGSIPDGVQVLYG